MERLNKTEQKIKDVLRRYPELPSHYIIRLIGKKEKTKGGFTVPYVPIHLKAMAANKQLTRFSTAHLKVSKHFSYSLNEAGYRDTNQRPHRLLESVTKADTEIGVRADPNYEYISFHDFLAKPNALPRALLDAVDEGRDPHLIALSKEHLHPDGPPFCVISKKTDQHVNYIDEIDRATEPLTTEKERRNIQEKFEHYREFFKEKIYRSHYGFQNCMLRFFTTSEARMYAMMRVYDKLYPGKCSFILFATTKDWINEMNYPRGDEIGRTFTRPYHRIGHDDYYMNAV